MSKELLHPLLPERPDFVKIELDILSDWEINKIFHKHRERNRGSKTFSWVEGPPTTNGLPHMGHALTRGIKDLVLRFQTMKGKYVVPRIGGWDCHGLPVELEVEKALGISTKQGIEDFGIDKFIEECRKNVVKYRDEWIVMSERMGMWVDFEHAYATMDNSYIESVWWSLKQLWQKKLLYKGKKVVPWCPRCGTPLSTHEVSLGQREKEDPAIYVKFQSQSDPSVFYLAWTTTPWTLVSNVALVVHPDYEYVTVQLEETGEKLVLVKELVESTLGKDTAYKVIDSRKGRELVGEKYNPVFNYVKPEKGKAFEIITQKYVLVTEGTGIVHTAPAFGADDAEAAREHNLAFLCPVQQDGTFDADLPDIGGLFAIDANEILIKKLKESGNLHRRNDIVHTYPFCPRCDHALLYYSTDSWFVGMSQLRKELVYNNSQVFWQPEHLKDGRFGNFLDEARDWAISRNRYWGTPLPVWVCPDDTCAKEICIGGRPELEEYGIELPENHDLHKPWIDNIKLACPDCKEVMIREDYVIDCWYDSGASPFAQYNYPFRNKENFEKETPYDFVTEAIDQTRGWFYTLLAISTAVFNKPAYLSVLSMGHILDDKGVKMSKSKGNSISPDDILDSEGADAMRWYLFSNTSWKPARFSPELVAQAQRRFILSLWNVSSFYISNANIDGYNPMQNSVPVKRRPKLDQWILSRLATVIEKADKEYENLSVHNVVKVADYFLVEDLSNWYLRLSRRRFWDATFSEDKQAAYSTLYEVLRDFLAILAPCIPFVTEYLYQHIVVPLSENAPESIHLVDFPSSQQDIKNQKLEQAVEINRELVVAGRSARTRAKVKNRQPLAEVIIVPKTEEDREIIESLQEELLKELNCKKISYTNSFDDALEYKLIPNFKLLAPRLREKLPIVQDYLNTLSSEQIREIMESIEESQEITLEIENNEIKLSKEEINVQSNEKEGLFIEDTKYGQIMLDCTLTDDLLMEGYSRDVIRRIQTMRKDMNLAYTDKINVKFTTDTYGNTAIDKFKQQICTETQAVTIEPESSLQDQAGTSWNFDGHTIILQIKIEATV